MADTTTFMLAMERNWDMISSAVADVDDAILTRQPNEQSKFHGVADLAPDQGRRPVRKSAYPGRPPIVGPRGLARKIQHASRRRRLWHGLGAGQAGGLGVAFQGHSAGVLLGGERGDQRLRSLPSHRRTWKRRFPAPPPANSQSVGEALGILVWDNCVHGGQIAYLRGLLPRHGLVPVAALVRPAGPGLAPGRLVPLDVFVGGGACQ